MDGNEGRDGRRKRWSEEEVRVLAECYAIATPGGVQSRGYMRRMHDAWCSRGLERQVTEVNLAN